MANVFSGLFSGGGAGSGQGLATLQYQQRLKDYQEAQDAYQQQQAMENIDPYIKQILQGMTPERQSHVKLQRAMMLQPALFEKGLEGFNRSISQRGTTLADILKQEKGLQVANAKHQFKMENPLPGDVGHKLEYAIAYAGGKEKFDAMSDEERQRTMDRAARARQLVDKGTHWEDIVSGEKYSKNVGEVETVKVVGRDIGERLTNFTKNRASQASLVTGFTDSLEALKRLDEGANNWTTGYAAFLRHLPQTDAKEWFAELETVNAQTVLDTMKELKSMSQTGSTGFGAVNIKELEVMMNKWGKIDPGMDDKAVKTVIQRRIEIMKKLNAKAQKALKEEQEWYRRNRYNLPKSAQEALPDEADIPPPPPDSIEVPQTDTPGFTILD